MKTIIRDSYKSNWALPIFIAISYFAYNILLIHEGHFHEDAYIMFIYVENLLNGHSISYYPNGPRAEGATDFLWLIMLTGLGVLGVDAGSASILLNSIGVLIISGVITRLIKGHHAKKHLYYLLPFSLLWMFQPFLVAALGGFSVFFYIAIVLLVFISVIEKKFTVYTPLLSIFLALLRPDGVILGISFTLIGAQQLHGKGEFPAYVKNMLIAAGVGIVYFLWRATYFDNLLPLPLYVKSSGEALAGLMKNLAWAQENIILLLVTSYLLYANGNLRKYSVLLIPVALFFLALTTAVQSQNVGYRFQAPIFIIVYYTLISQLVIALNTSNNKKIKFLIVFLALISGLFGLKQIRHANAYIKSPNYINQFPFELSQVLKNDITIALTEAGRMAYWNQSGNKIVDLVGLNTEYSAKNMATEDYIETLSPSLLMYHHAGLINPRNFPKQGITPYFALNIMDKKYLTNKLALTETQRSKNKVRNASFVMTNYLQHHFDEYEIFLVDYIENQTFSHVYAFKKGLLTPSQINNLFQSAFYNKGEHLSYYQMKSLEEESGSQH